MIRIYQSVPQWLVSSQNALYSPLERESLRDETKGCERDYSCNRYSNRENHSSTVSRLKYKIPRNFIPKSKLKTVVSPIDPNQRYIAISKKWRHTGQEKRSWPFQYSAIFSVIWNFVCNSASRLTYIKINNSLLFHYNISWIKLLIIKIIK